MSSNTMTDKKVISSFAWKLGERMCSQGLVLTVQIILARLLEPITFGSLAIIMVFINIATVFIQKGFVSSLVRKKQVDSLDCDTALISSMVIALVMILIIFLISPIIETYYKTPNFNICLRALSIGLLFGALYSIENAILVREMKFKQIFIRSLVSATLSGTIGIMSAACGLGLWALVLQSLSNIIILCITTFFSCNWIPKFRFSRERFREIYSFGSKILLSELIVFSVDNIRTLIIGKRYSTDDLAYFDRGQTYPNAAMQGIYDALSSVLLPAFSTIQDERDKLVQYIEKSISLMSYIVFPLFMGLAALSKPLIFVIFTEKWSKCIPFFAVFCIYQIPFPIYGIVRQSLYAIGNSSAVLVLEILRSVVTIGLIIIGIQFGPIMIAAMSFVGLLLSIASYLIYTHKLIHYSFRKIFKSLTLSLLMGLVMITVIFVINNFDINNEALLIIDIIVGIIIYVGLSSLTKNENFTYYITLLKKRKNRN